MLKVVAFFVIVTALGLIAGVPENALFRAVWPLAVLSIGVCWIAKFSKHNFLS